MKKMNFELILISFINHIIIDNIFKSRIDFLFLTTSGPNVYRFFSF